jgi:myo-inositol 2-dehydrogenase / D-chiro-inositol 1-dehydrogenase
MDSFTRRSFLKVPAALAAAPAVPASQSEPLRVAFVGVGNRGSFLLRHMMAVPGVKVVAVCDIVPERAAKAAEMVAAAGGSATTWTDFRKMLDESRDIDAVVQAAPDWTHKDLNIAILEMGRHLYAEKPLALTPADCTAVVNEAGRSKKTFQVGFQLRHDPGRAAAMNFAHSGGLGRVLMCHGTRHSGEGLPRTIPWYHDREKSGDIVIDQGIHILDLFRWAIGGHPLRAYGTGGINLFKDEPPGRTSMDGYSVIYEYAGGVYVNFSHHFYDPPGFTGFGERVFGSEGSVDLARAVWQPREKREPVKLAIPDQGQDSSYMALAAFVESVRTGSRPLNDAQSAHDSTLMAIMGTRAIYGKRVVTWEEVLAG